MVLRIAYGAPPLQLESRAVEAGDEGAPSVPRRSADLFYLRQATRPVDQPQQGKVTTTLVP